MKKDFAKALSRVALCFFLFILLWGITSCAGPPGQPYLAYCWVWLPQYIYDENPSVPSTITNGDYFTTDPGTYYMEYIAWDGSAWWMEYTITVNEGGAFFAPGTDSYFEVWLFSSGPSFYEWDSARNKTSRSSGTKELIRSGFRLVITYGRLFRSRLP